jgi:hypothetical protein
MFFFCLVITWLAGGKMVRHGATSATDKQVEITPTVCLLLTINVLDSLFFYTLTPGMFFFTTCFEILLINK